LFDRLHSFRQGEFLSAGSPPGAETVFDFNHNDVVFLDHRHKFLFEFFFPKFSFVESIPHRFTILQIPKARIQKNVSASSTERNGPRILRNSVRWLGLIL
jgi:hypothetical protein